jgi:RNA polymerase sigma-70 factor (ECF subfamily)
LHGDFKPRLNALMRRLADGDRTALAPAFEMLWPAVRRFALRALNESPDAEDAAQQALLKLFAQVAQYDAERDALAWALSVTAYECRTWRKQRARRRETVETAARDRSDPAADPEAAAIARDLEQAAREVLQSLSALDVATLEAVIGGERPAIAGATFRKRVARALERLRAAWSTRHDVD